MESKHVHLRPLEQKDAQSLYKNVGSDPQIFKWMLFATPSSIADYENLVNNFINESFDGGRESFAVVLKENNDVIGHTSYMDFQDVNKSIEIGTTFYSKTYWRSFVNTECKFLLLSEIFENRKLHRVTLKTDANNERSKSAILRLGAVYEGALKENMQRPDGSWRDTAYFSILENQWPEIKDRLIKKIK
jgi:RimJ/RimL family protein N-acetyltransferase